MKKASLEGFQRRLGMFMHRCVKRILILQDREIAEMAGLADLGDLDAGVDLAVARAAAAVLAATELLDVDLFAHVSAQNLRADNHARHGRLADLEPRVIGDGQNPVKRQFRTRFDFAKIDLQLLTFLDAKLATTVFDDCVHAYL